MEDIKRSAQLLIARNKIVEVRVLAKGKIISSGYYDNPDALVKAVAKVDSNTSVKGIYITLNKPMAEHTHNLNQLISQNTKKLSDRHMERVTSLLIDLDPERKPDTNSTAGELEAARLRCLAVGGALAEVGFPEPAIFMSGNGYHALYAIDLPVEDKALVRDFLKALDHKFSDDVVKVDTSVYNPARITKLYGTMTRKGPNTPQRPQRRSTIESIPDNIVEVTREQLQMVIGKWGAPTQKTKPLLMSYQAPSQRTHHATRNPVDVPAYCQKAGLEIIGTKADSGSTIYKLKECAFNPEHKNNDAAIIAGADGIVRYQCFHNSCQGRTFQEACNQLGVKPDEWSNNGFAPVGLNADGSWPDITLFTTDDTPAATYPIEALPEVIRTAAKEAARFCKVDPAGPAAVGVSVVAAAIGKKAAVEERPGLYHHPALFVMIEAGPGMRKSETAKIMGSPFDSWAHDHAEEYKEELARIGFKNSLVDTAIAARQSEAKKENADRDSILSKITTLEAEREPLPASPQLYASDITEQRLFQLMHEHGGSFAIFSGEGRQVINQILGRNSDGTGEALYLAGISGDTITRDRVGNEKGPEHKAIFNPCLNVCIFVQPDKARELVTTPAMQASGLVQRIDRLAPPSTAGTREEAKNEPGLNLFALESYRQAVNQILNISATDEPHKVKLSPEAQEARRLFHNEIEQQLGADGNLSDVADLASKCCSKVVKYAMAFHLAENPNFLIEDTSQISLDTWSRAEQVGRFHLQEAVRLQRSAFADKDLETARKIARWLFSKQIESFTKSKLMQFGPYPRPNKNQADKILIDLVDYGVIMKQQKTYKVNPALSSSSLATLAGIAVAALENETPEPTPATAKAAKTAKVEGKNSDNYPCSTQIAANGDNMSFD